VLTAAVAGLMLVTVFAALVTSVDTEARFEAAQAAYALLR
jgi:hypothetical protein